MKIDDQILSGFLDNELSAHEMNMVRDAIAEDERLAMRLAELSEVDMLVQQHAAQIDAMPLPDKLAQTLEQQSTASVIPLSKQQKITRTSYKHIAIAASIAGLFAVGIGNMAQQHGLEQTIANVLDHQLSGDTTVIGGNRTVTAQLSFVNTNGEYCRQYTLDVDQVTQSHIACKQDGTWQLKQSSKQLSNIAQGYRLATSSPELDSYIDEHIDGQPLDRKTEQRARDKHWQ